MSPAGQQQDVKSAGLADAYRAVASDLGCPYFDSATVISASRIDGVHLDADQHRTLGEALAGVVSPLLVD